MNVVLVAVASAVMADDRLHPWPIQVEVRVSQGDPLGSRAEGTVRYLCEPRVITTSGRPAFFRAGGRPVAGDSGINGPGVEVFEGGVELEVVPFARPWGKIEIEVRATAGRDGKPVSLTRTVASGDGFRSRLAAESAESQTWADVTVTRLTRHR